LEFAGFASGRWPLRVRSRALLNPAGRGNLIMMTDPIADMLTRIRNANMATLEKVDVPASKMKIELTKILKDKGFIKSFKVIRDRKQGVIRISMKYLEGYEKVITGLKRISTPGRRVYVDKTEIPEVMGGYGIAVLSTSRGILTDETCRREGVGGEVLCNVW
jgi:small subunit ribosomal protein S8